MAVIYDKNIMEASGYAYTMARVCNEPVHLVPLFEQRVYENMENPEVQRSKFDKDGILKVLNDKGDWVSIRACFRYVTQ